MTPAEFEEKTYEWPLYNQLEHGQQFVYTPGQVMENLIGFDAGMFATRLALWQTLGYSSPPAGTVLSEIAWPLVPGLKAPKGELPGERLNLFLQAKRPVYYQRIPKKLKNLNGIGKPLWAFNVTEHQQKLLEALATATQGAAHVS